MITGKEFIKLFSKGEEQLEEKKDKVKLGKSSRGWGRVLDRGGLIKGSIALGLGKKAAEKAAEEGKSESEVIDAAGKKSKRAMRAMVAGTTGALATAAGVGINKGVKLVLINGADDIKKAADKVTDPIIKKIADTTVKNPGKVGKVLGGTASGLIVLGGAKRAFRKGRLAENAAHKNTIERIKNAKETEE